MEMTDRRKLFSDAPVSKAVLALAVPTVISQLINVVYNMADTFYIGQLNDPEQVAAATLAMPCFLLLTAFSNLFGLGGSSLISRCLGAGNTEKARKTVAFCIWSGIVFAFLYGILVYLFRNSIFPILGAKDKASNTWIYLEEYIFWTVVVGAVPTVMNAEFAHLIRAEGYSRQAGFGIALGGVLNIALDPLFIFVFDMGIKGAAVATMLSNVIAMIFFVLFILKIRKDSVISFDIRKFSLNKKIVAEVIMVGLPGAFMTMMSTVSNIGLNNVVSKYSDIAIAGMGIAKKIDLLAYAIAQGMAQGVLPLIGFNYSTGNKARMKKSILTATLYSLIVAVTGTFLLYFCAVPIISAFISDAETVAYGQSFLKVICISCPTTAINFMVITIFQAIGKKVQPMILAMMRKGTLDVLFVVIFDRIWGMSGISWATPISDWMAFIVAMIFLIPLLKTLGDDKKEQLTEE